MSITDIPSIDRELLQAAVTQTQGPEGASFDQIATQYEQQAGTTSPYQLTTALQRLVDDGRLLRTKGPRGENLYRNAPQEVQDPLARLEEQKRQLLQALGTLTSAVTFATARLDQHQKRDDQWRELLQANDEAKRALETSRE